MTADAVGGVWTYAIELSQALADHDFEVTLCVMGPAPDAEQSGDLAGSAVARAYVGEYALEWMDDPWEDVERAGQWLLEIAADVKPDVVHLNGYVHAPLPWNAPVVVVGHSDVLSWHEAVRSRPAGPEWSRYGEEVAVGLAAAHLLVAPTQAMLDELVRLYEPSCPRLVIPNGSGRAFPPLPKSQIVLGAGRVWDEAKNVGALVRVAPRLEWPIVVCGDGAVGDGVTALGRLDREQLDRMLASTAIFAAPARYEPFGLAALEAARAGCALVLGDIPSLREVWGSTALYVPPDDNDELERTLHLLINHPDLRADYASRARRRANGFTAERMADGYASAYRRLFRNAVVGAA
jgi:glycogen(starch) synthase